MSGDDGAFFAVNAAEWPLVTVDLQRAPINDAEIDAFQEAFIHTLQIANDSKDPICLCMVLDGLMDATLQQQFRAGSFIDNVRELVVPSIFCTALVVKNKIVRAILFFILKLKPLKSLYRVFETSEQALEWTRMNALRKAAGEPAVLEAEEAFE